MPQRETATNAEDRLELIESAVRGRVEDHVDQVVRRVAGTIPSLGRDSTVSLEELSAAAWCTFTTSLGMLARQRGPSELEVTAWRNLSRRSAQLGVPLEDVLQAVRICANTLWEALGLAANRLGGDCPFDVLEQAPRLWLNFDHMASVVTEAHQAEGSAREVEHSQRVCAFLAAVRRHPNDASTAEALARLLGFDPSGWFVAVVYAAGSPKPAPRDGLIVSEEPNRTILLLQTPESAPEGEEEASWLMEDLQCASAGIGVQRSGLDGARQALLDAEAAHETAVALNLRVVKFRTRWLTCLAVKNRDQYETLVVEAVAYLRDDESMRQTVAAYLRAEGSLPATAALLGLHANTVAYRLRQLADRTGLDARSADGSALAQVALTFAQIRAGATAEPLRQEAS